MKAPKIAMWIKADGQTIPVVPLKGKKFTLKEVQDMVGGYVERLRLPHAEVMLVNEDGLAMGLAANDAASRLAGTTIVGDVVVLPKGMGW